MAKKSNSYWDKRALERFDATELKTKKATERIKKIYSQAYHNVNKELESVYRNYSDSAGIDQQKLKEILSKSQTEQTFKQLKRQGLDKYIQDNYKARISRLEQIKAQIYGKAKLIYSKEELEHTMLYDSVLNDNYYKTIYDTQMGTGYNFSFSQLDKNTMNSLLTEKWSGKNYSQRIWQNTDLLAERLSTIVGAGLMSGQSMEKMARQIRNEFNVAKYYAERLARTESSYFHNQADMLAYQDLGVDKYVFVATLDSRTSEICQEMDNKKFDYDKIEVGVNFPPMHPNCRSTTRGYLGDEAEKMLKRRARNPITGQTEMVDNVSYKQWSKNVMGVDKNSSRGNNNELVGTGKVYTPRFSKIEGNHSIENDVKNTNPRYNRTQPEWYKNCQRCVPTYEMRRRGYDVEAKPKYQTDKISRMPQIVYNNPELKYFTKNAKNTIIKEMKKWGDGSRCQICAYWNVGGGHTFVAENQNGKILFVDPQVNDMDVSKYFKHIRVRDSYFYRIDNLEVTDYIKDCCKGVVKNVKRGFGKSKGVLK